MTKIGLTIYGCEKDEAEMFNNLSPHYGIDPVMTSSPLSHSNISLAAGQSWISVNHKSVVSESLLLALKEKGVKYISTRSIGCNHIDVEAAIRLGITIRNVTYSPDSVADFTLMLILMALRHARSILRRVDRSDYRLEPVRGKVLREMTVGVLGTGRIGMAVIERLRGFGCRVIACGSNYTPEVEHVSFHDLLQRSDILTIHVPLNKASYHMIGSEQLRIMKPGAILINTARGGIVDTDALIQALEQGLLGGAALDVIEGEDGIFYLDCSHRPIPNQKLLRLQQMPNVIITPHTAYYTEQALREIVEMTLMNCLNFERSQRL